MSYLSSFIIVIIRYLKDKYKFRIITRASANLPIELDMLHDMLLRHHGKPPIAQLLLREGLGPGEVPAEPRGPQRGVARLLHGAAGGAAALEPTLRGAEVPDSPSRATHSLRKATYITHIYIYLSGGKV